MCLHRDCDVSQINYMYAQYVKNTMQPLNIVDVAKDQRFPWTVSIYFLLVYTLLFVTFIEVSNYLMTCPMTE